MISKITNEEAMIAAKLYIGSLFALSDDFQSEEASCEVNKKIQHYVNLEISKMLKNLNLEKLPTDTKECIAFSKDIVYTKNLKK